MSVAYPEPPRRFTPIPPGVGGSSAVTTAPSDAFTKDAPAPAPLVVPPVDPAPPKKPPPPPAPLPVIAQPVPPCAHPPLEPL
jgi:hypothetical protein